MPHQTEVSAHSVLYAIFTVMCFFNTHGAFGLTLLFIYPFNIRNLSAHFMLPSENLIS